MRSTSARTFRAGSPWAGTLALVAAMALVVGCGGGSASDRVDRPVVRNFSPFLSPIDFNTLQQNPTFTNSDLTVSTDPNYPGKIVVFFQSSTEIAPASVFLGGNPFLGVDPSALQVTQEIPGTGNVQIPIEVEVLADRIICQPLPPYANPLGGGLFQTNLPDGQYTVAVFKNIKNTEGKELVRGPVFQAFTVGNNDTIAPRVLTTDPVNGQQEVGAGVPPPAGPPGFEDTIADITVEIFGPRTPDITVRFTEGVRASSVNAANFTVVDAGAFPNPVNIVPAPGFPKLKSDDDGETLPSNGFEAIWRADPLFGGFPFGTQVQVTVIGSDTGANPSPITDLAGNQMEDSYQFQFQTIAPPDLPQNPFPEFAIWWSASDRIGTIDTINQQGLADQFTGTQTFPLGVPMDVIPAFTDTVATDQSVPNFDPFEIVIDTRTNAGTCHSWVYVQSAASGQVAIVNSRNSVPVALINSPSPGGVACQTAAQGPQVLLVTNSSANTYTAYSLGSLTPGTAFLNGPLFVTTVKTTGNTPKAISISVAPPPGLIPDHWNRGTAGVAGPGTEVIMWADFTDGVVNTGILADDDPVRQFALGASAAPNDISITPCFGIPPIMFAAISQGGLPGEGKVAYYLAGPGCNTGVSAGANADSIVGDLTGFDGPAGISDLFVLTTDQAFWAVAESGSDAVSTLGFLTGTFNTPRVIATFTNVGDNPTVTTTRPAWLNPCIAIAGSNGCFRGGAPTCWYNGTEQDVLLFNLIDGTFNSAADMYICARGAGFVNVIDQVSGAPPRPNPQIAIPGIRYIATPVRQ